MNNRRRKTRLKNVPVPPADMPLVQMTPEQLQATFDELGLGNTFALLQEARRHENNRLVLVQAVLNPGGHFVLTDLEWGDSDATDRMLDFIEQVERTPGLLLEGETLTLQFRRVTATEPEPEPLKR